MEAREPEPGHPWSDGWTLLERLRPEALQAHGALLRRLGTSLPPATRQLLFLSMCVIQGSERGMRRHACRALAAGATGDHVTDAVVMALPISGPARVAEALRVLEATLALGPAGEDPEP